MSNENKRNAFVEKTFYEKDHDFQGNRVSKVSYEIL